ncbi:MAG: hypothetical protein LBF82_03765 [Lactobacillales bacterium]|jgi:hypothetical protein|nr:hypothetical protein [Lactobacillales bacterium]
MSESKILGIRSSSKEIRYAILEKKTDSTIVFTNRETENKLVYPASLYQIDVKLKWLRDELHRIFRQNSNITQVVIKTNEFGIIENKATRKSTYADAIIICVAVELQIPVSCKLYSQIGSNSKGCETLVQKRGFHTKKYWDTKIADAILAALSEL